MRKRRSLIVSLALALLLVFSAPFALAFNKDKSAKAEITGAVDGTGFFVNTTESNTFKSYFDPFVATQANGLAAEFSKWENKGVVVPLAKNSQSGSYNDETLNSLVARTIKTVDLDVTNATKDNALISFAPIGEGGTLRVYLVKITDGTNAINVYLNYGNTNSAAASAYLYTATTGMFVQASGQSKIGGLSDGATGTFVERTFDAVGSTTDPLFESSVTSGYLNTTKGELVSIYYDATEKAIYTDNASGVKTLVRDLDATDVTNGEDTAFAGFSGPVSIEISHATGGGYTASVLPTANSCSHYGVVVTALDGIDLAHNSFGYLASYDLTGTTITSGAYAFGAETVVAVGDAVTLPALERVDGEDLASGEADGWNTTVYNASKEDVTATALSGDTFTAPEVGTYVVYRTKTVDETTTYVSYDYTAVQGGFENEVANIFDTKATDGMGKATVSFTTDLTTGESKVPAYSPLQNTGALLNYKGVPALGTTGETNLNLAKSYAHIPSVKISDNTSSNILVSATPLGTTDTAFDELVAMSVAVYEKADPSNYFVVTVYYFEGGGPLHAQAAATGQSAFGTRGASATQSNTALTSGDAAFTGFGSKAINFSYDNTNKAVYINGKLIRDFDATDNTNGTGSRVIWGGFKTDEVGVMIINGNGGGRVVVSNIDGNDLSYGLIETASGYTAGLVTPIREDNYNATTFANIGESVVVPAPTSKKITGEFIEREDITVATVKVNGGEAVAYEKGVTTFTAVAGINKIEYLDGSTNVVATAYVKAYDKSLESAVTGGTAQQGVKNPIGLMAPGDNRLAQHKGVGAATVKDGLLVSAQRPSGEVTETNQIVTVTLDKEIYIGDLDASTPLIDFSHMPEYISQQAVRLGVSFEDENGNTVKITSERQIPKSAGDPLYYGSSVTTDLSPIFVFVNGTKVNLRHKSSEWYNGNGFVAKGVYTSGYYPGHLAVYFDKATQTLSVKGQSFGDNEILTHLNPSNGDIATYKYPAGRPRITLGNVVKVSFEFMFDLDADYAKAEQATTAVLSGKNDASMLVTTLAGHSLAQTNGVYTKNGVTAPKTVEADVNAYAVGDTVTVPAVSSYYDFWADGGVALGDPDGYTVDVYDATSTKVASDVAKGGTFTPATFGTHTLVYKKGTVELISTEIAVSKKRISLNANDLTKFALDVSDASGVTGSVPTLIMEEDGYVVVKIDPVAGYVLTSATIGGVEQITSVDITGAEAQFRIEYDDINDGAVLYAELQSESAIKFDIVYDTAGGALAGEAGTDYQVEYSYNAPAYTLPVPTKVGYTFAGWLDGMTPVTEIAQGASKDYYLTATWTANEYTATFNSDGGSAVANATIYHDGVVTAPANPVKAGYVFDGWFLDGATTPYDFTTPVTGDVTLVAKWTMNRFTVTFTDGVASQTLDYGAKVTKPTDPTKAGFTFGGWLYGVTPFDFENTVVTSNMALTAVWTPASVTVTFDLNGGSGTADAQTIIVGAYAKKPANPTKEGYVFAGWYNGDVKYTFAEGITENVTLTAKWVEAPVVEAPVEDKEGCGKEAVGLLAVVLSALAVVFVTKKR